ncbi:MAG: hypothetical protein C0425_10830 [Chlorobiaceae bacterium]|nr:hypothetical protein [Chlorobiaceae bacterium]
MKVVKNYLFLGFALPDQIMKKVFEEDSFPQVQTHNFNWNIIKGIERDAEIQFTYISSRPVTEFPSFPYKIIKSKVWSERVGDKKIEIQEIPFINKGISKIFSKLISSFYYSMKNFSLKPNKAGIIVYSVHIPYMIVGLMISKIYKIPLISIWTDPPAVVRENESYFKKKIRIIELKIAKYLMKKSSKVISLTKYLARDFAPNIPYLVIEGIINIEEANEWDVKITNKPRTVTKFIYTGSLEKKYGIQNIVESFEILNRDDILLEIYGRGDFENDLISRIKGNKNIIYKGYVFREEILKIQRGADYLINARNSKDEFVKYSFPSKTLEYMLSGTPLITTMLPGIPDEYREYVILIENNRPETIANKINEILNSQNLKNNELGIKARTFAKTKNYLNQGDKILEFIKF